MVFESLRVAITNWWIGTSESERLRKVNLDKLVKGTGFTEEEVLEALDHSENDLHRAVEFLKAQLRRKEKRDMIQRRERRQAKRHDKRKKVTSKAPNKIVHRANRENRRIERYSYGMKSHLDMDKRKASRKSAPFRFPVQDCNDTTSNAEHTMPVGNPRRSFSPSQLANVLTVESDSQEECMKQSSEEENMNNSEDEEDGEQSEEEEIETRLAHARGRRSSSQSSMPQKQKTISRPSNTQKKVRIPTPPIHKKNRLGPQKQQIFALVDRMKKTPATLRRLSKDLKKVGRSRLADLSDHYETGDAAKLVALLQQEPDLLNTASTSLDIASTALSQKAEKM